MWALWKKQPAWRRGAPRRTDLLLAVPVKNPVVREKALPRRTRRLGESTLRLTGALARSRGEKSFELDELGEFVWQSVDGTRTVEGLIRHFASEKRVNLREAEVAVLAFLKMLAKKNLLALRVGGKGEAAKR